MMKNTRLQFSEEIIDEIKVFKQFHDLGDMFGKDDSTNPGVTPRIHAGWTRLKQYCRVSYTFVD